jgi:hypothetical protein
VVGKHLTAGAALDKIGDDRRFADAGLAHDQHAFFGAVTTPVLDLVKDPLPAAECFTPLVKNRSKAGRSVGVYSYQAPAAYGRR